MNAPSKLSGVAMRMGGPNRRNCAVLADAISSRPTATEARFTDAARSRTNHTRNSATLHADRKVHLARVLDDVNEPLVQRRRELIREIVARFRVEHPPEK